MSCLHEICIFQDSYSKRGNPFFLVVVCACGPKALHCFNCFTAYLPQTSRGKVEERATASFDGMKAVQSPSLDILLVSWLYAKQACRYFRGILQQRGKTHISRPSSLHAKSRKNACWRAVFSRERTRNSHEMCQNQNFLKYSN